MKKYKVIAVSADEFVTGEYENQAENMEEAKNIAEDLYKEVDDGTHCDVRVEIYPIDEYINLPSEDYPVLIKDCDGIMCWATMRMGTYCRIGIRL